MSHPVAVVFSDQHPREVLDAFGAQRPDTHLYVCHRDAVVETHRGLPIKTLQGINAEHVVWVGIPARWAASKVGSDSLFHSHHVGNRARFSRIHEMVLVHRAIDQALELMALKGRKLKEEAEAALNAKVASDRRLRLGAAPPWFIPEVLR